MDELEVREETAVNMTKTLWMLYESACHRQVGPDGKDCALCGDKTHQAFECRYNAFVRFDVLRRAAWELCAKEHK